MTVSVKQGYAQQDTVDVQSARYNVLYEERLTETVPGTSKDTAYEARRKSHACKQENKPLLAF